MIARCVCGRCRHRKIMYFSLFWLFGQKHTLLLNPALLSIIQGSCKDRFSNLSLLGEMWRVEMGRKDCEFKLDKVLCLWKLKMWRFTLWISICLFFFFIKTSIKRQLIAFNAALNFLWAGFSLSRMVPSQDSSAVLQLLWCFLGYLSSQGWSCS